MLGFLNNLDEVHPSFSTTLSLLMSGFLITNTVWKTQPISINYDKLMELLKFQKFDIRHFNRLHHPEKKQKQSLEGVPQSKCS